MKINSFVFLLFLLIIIIVPSNAKDCYVEGSPEDFVNKLNVWAELMTHGGYKTSNVIKINNCKYEILDKNSGVYSCPINASNELDIFTDKYLKATAIKVCGITQNGNPKEATIDWALAVESLVCGKMSFPDSQELFIKSLNNGYYANKDIEMVCGIEPNTDNNIWTFIISNK